MDVVHINLFTDNRFPIGTCISLKRKLDEKDESFQTRYSHGWTYAGDDGHNPLKVFSTVRLRLAIPTGKTTHGQVSVSLSVWCVEIENVSFDKLNMFRCKSCRTTSSDVFEILMKNVKTALLNHSTLPKVNDMDRHTFSRQIWLDLIVLLAPGAEDQILIESDCWKGLYVLCLSSFSSSIILELHPFI